MEKKIVIVTGGGGLLGKAMIDCFAERGYVAVNFDINIETDPSNQHIFCDITSDKSVNEAIDVVMKSYGRVDALINNAYPRTRDWGRPFEEIDPESWRKNVDWQLNSHFVISQRVIKHMVVQRSGNIVNIASIYGVVGNDFTIYEGTPIVPPAAYSAIKGGTISFTRYLASCYGKFGIRVNCVSPGGIFDNQPEKFVKAYERRVPMGRMGSPSDIAPVVEFLVSDDSRYITGQNIIVDGGWTAI